VYVLGVSAFYHDSAAALVQDGEILAAAQEERFTRKKHDSGFPRHAIASCLSDAAIKAADLDYVVFYDKPLLKLERLLETYVGFAPRGLRSFLSAIPVWMKDKLFQKRHLSREFQQWDDTVQWDDRLLFTEHHQSHAASAFYPSPFPRALVLTMDGVGEWATTSAWLGEGRALTPLKEIHFPHSLGLLYSAFTYFTGFKVNSGEYKLMGLAPYGEPRYADVIRRHLIDIKDDGSFWLDVSYFDYCTGLRMTNRKFAGLFGGPERWPEQPITQREMDIARSIQDVTEEVVLKLVAGLVKETGVRDLCLAGGVALNCVANGRLLRSGVIDDLWVQPAAGDAGGAVGAALAAYHLFLGQERARTPGASSDGMKGAYLGPDFADDAIGAALAEQGAIFRRLDDDALLDQATDDLIAEKVVGWFQGRMESGPRALGGRSILGDPRSPRMQATMNLKIKYRESFRPFAPAVLRERVGDYFELERDSPYMLVVADVRADRRRAMTEAERALFGIDKLNVPRSDIPAVTHVDYSARIQTVHAETNPRFHRLLREFEEKSGCAVLVNTSFNVRGEPIVCTPADAFRCFMGTEMDALAIGNFYLRKQDQDPRKRLDYKDRFHPD
jgi:carbamoyltransferase